MNELIAHHQVGTDVWAAASERLSVAIREYDLLRSAWEKRMEDFADRTLREEQMDRPTP